MMFKSASSFLAVASILGLLSAQTVLAQLSEQLNPAADSINALPEICKFYAFNIQT